MKLETKRLISDPLLTSWNRVTSDTGSFHLLKNKKVRTAREILTAEKSSSTQRADSKSKARAKSIKVEDPTVNNDLQSKRKNQQQRSNCLKQRHLSSTNPSSRSTTSKYH